MKNLLSTLDKQKYLILVFITGIAYTLFMFSDVLKNPNELLSVKDGDGLKNYYAYLTNVSEQGALNQLSFNYPYGESYLFTDSHPFLSRTLHFVNKICPDTELNSIGILNTLMVLNFFFTYLVLFLLLRRFIKKEWYSMLWAFAIMILQPQILRMGGHLSLSYSVAIPLCFYWTILYDQTKNKILYGSLLLISNFFWFGIHAYLGLMTCGFTLLFDLYLFLFNKEYRNTNHLSWCGVKSIVPLVLFFIYLTVIDIHTGRTTNPWGFFQFNSNFESIFLPYAGWGKRFLQNLIPIPISQKWEGVAYIGLVSTICFFTLTFFAIKRLYQHYVKKREWIKLPFEMGLFAPALFAAIIWLLYAMGFPFNLGLEFILDQLSFIKNFRATGRFAWPFYYVITSFSAYAISEYVKVKWNNKRKIWVYFILIFPPFLTILEGIPYQKSAYKERFKIDNVFLFQNLDYEYQEVLKKINPTQYQAVIPLPFYQGSENFSKTAPNQIHNLSMIFAYHLQLPLTSSHFARSSIWESRNLTQMFAPEFYEKYIADDIPSNKKFLIISITEDLTEYEQSFLKKASFLFKANDVEFWEIETEKITEVVTEPYFADFNQKREFLIPQNNYFLSKPDFTVFLFSFDTNTSRYKFLGTGAYEKPKKERYSVVLEIEPNKFYENKEYEISFWYYVGGKNYGQDKLSWKVFISQHNKISGEKFSLLDEGSRSKGNPVVLEDWALATYRFTIKNKNYPTKLVISKTQCKGYNTTIDEILIRPVDIDVYRILEQEDKEIKKIYINGHIIQKQYSNL